MTGSGFHKVSEEIVASGNIVTFGLAFFATPSGEVVRRELIHHPGAVAVVAVDEGGRTVLVRQYRAPLDEHLVEIPAGKLDVAGEEPRLAAERELAEEVGREAASWQELGRVIPSPGFCDEEIFLYLATDLTEVPFQRHGPEEQDMTVEWLPLDEAIAAVTAPDRRADAKTVLGLLLARERLAGR